MYKRRQEARQSGEVFIETPECTKRAQRRTTGSAFVGDPLAMAILFSTVH